MNVGRREHVEYAPEHAGAPVEPVDLLFGLAWLAGHRLDPAVRSTIARPRHLQIERETASVQPGDKAIERDLGLDAARFVDDAFTGSQNALRDCPSAVVSIRELRAKGLHGIIGRLDRPSEQPPKTTT